MSWTHDMEETVRRHWKNESSNRQLARMVGKSTAAVRRKAARLGLRSVRTGLWSRDQIRVLRLNWGKHSAAVIGRKLGKSRNAVLGKAHRLGLERPEKPADEPEPIVRRSLEHGPVNGCQWLDGEPRERKFCGAPTVQGSSFCDHHHGIVWIKHADYQSEAA